MLLVKDDAGAGAGLFKRAYPLLMTRSAMSTLSSDWTFERQKTVEQRAAKSSIIHAIDRKEAILV